MDTSPVMKVSSFDDASTSRRDSWDVITKTKNILSNRSLESVANLTEVQLNSNFTRSKDDENEKFVLNEHSYQDEHHYKSNYGQNFNTYTTDKFDEDYEKKMPVFKSKHGVVAAVKVQPVPDGVLGQPVEFESKYQIFIYNR